MPLIPFKINLFLHLPPALNFPQLCDSPLEVYEMLTLRKTSTSWKVLSNSIQQIMLKKIRFDFAIIFNTINMKKGHEICNLDT